MKKTHLLKCRQLLDIISSVFIKLVTHICLASIRRTLLQLIFRKKLKIHLCLNTQLVLWRDKYFLGPFLQTDEYLMQVDADLSEI